MLRQVVNSYEELEREMIKELNKLGAEGIYKRGILATSENNFVTARRMGLIPDGLTIYCWTQKNTRKYNQIKANPNVAVVVGFIQIEGKASIKKHPKDEPEFLEVYKKQNPERYAGSVSHWHEVDYVLIEIAPNRISRMKYAGAGDREAYLNVLNVSKREAHRVYFGTKISSDDIDSPVYNE